ncbi:22386_t:CDS:2, partial [Cetraspora pellucida]
MQNGVVNKIVPYNIYDAIMNAAEAWSMVSPNAIKNCWQKTGILPYDGPQELIELDQDSVMDDKSKLTEPIGCLLTDDSFTAYEYIHAEDDEVKAELCVNKTLRFLYEQDPEFRDVDEK